MPATSPCLEIVYQTPAGRLNEDAWLAMQAGPLGDRIVMAAIDGATTRLTPPALQRELDALGTGLTPAAYAARTVRDSLARQVGAGLPDEVRTLLLEANADLGRDLLRLFGALTLEALQLPEEIYAKLQDDPRLVRLGLPACVATLAVYDGAEHTLHYAHAGDSLLMIVYKDGRVRLPTQPDDAVFDPGRVERVQQLRAYYPGMSYRQLMEQPEAHRSNMHAALYHNYVDELGLPQPSQGIGVLNGLPELRYFIQAGTIPLVGVDFICVLTDGLEWHADAQELFAPTQDEASSRMDERRNFIARSIRSEGLSGYLDLLREAEAADADHERYPRIKTHDDAAGVLLRFK